jgi:hypothetical protein
LTNRRPHDGQLFHRSTSRGTVTSLERRRGRETRPRLGQGAGRPNARYRKAHLWYDAENEDNFTAYKLLIADVIDGQLTAVPRGIIAAAGVVDGARGGLDVPDSDLPKLRRHLARYYTKMDESPPWK